MSICSKRPFCLFNSPTWDAGNPGSRNNPEAGHGVQRSVIRLRALLDDERGAGGDGSLLKVGGDVLLRESLRSAAW